MKHAKFLVSHFDAGAEKYKVGDIRPLDDETRLCIARGAAVEVDVEDVPSAETQQRGDETDPAGSDAQAADETGQPEEPAAAGKSSGKGKK